jgi:HD-like signal output (HDOD) protein
MGAGAESLLIRRYIDRAMADLPPMPQVVIQVIQRVENENVTMNELNDLIIQDSAITTKLLKVVNSAYFGLPRQITQISHAISILGLQQVRNLLLGLGVLNALRSDNPRVLKMQEGHWMQAFAAGVAAEEMSKKLRLSKTEREMVFVAALLQDIGRLFLITMFSLPYQEVVRESLERAEPISRAETRVLGMNHCELGAALANRWNFPDSLTHIIRCHEGPFGAHPDPCEAIVHISGFLSFDLADPKLTGSRPILDPSAAAWAPITSYELEAIRRKMKESLEQTASLLGMAA